jgi:RNA polymerase sigma-70 factor (ECF subfamily)
LRARRARPDAAADDQIGQWTFEPVTHTIDPVEALAAERDATRVRAALIELPLLQRTAIELAYYEGLTQREVAERLEEPLGTVKTRIRLGLLKLRDALSGRPAEEGA